MFLTDQQRDQADKVKEECYKLALLLNQPRLEIKYVKQRKFDDDGVLDLFDIYHHFTSN